MENLSHSRHTNRLAPSLPKKPCNGSGGYGLGSGKASATTYDDVFGGPPRFGAPSLSPRLEDYCEIFGGFNGSARFAVSSIPVLDLPLADDGDVYFDVRSTGFDYREVFGGFEDFDLAPSYEELLMEPSEGGNGDSSDEAWTPVETESVSGGTEHSGKSPCFSNGRDSYESIDGSTEFSISYNKVAQGSSTNMSNGTAHHHSYNFTVDEVAYAGRTTKEKHIKKTRSLASSNMSSYAFGSGDGARKRCSRTGSFPSETFMTISDISLKTQPSELPPPSRPPPTLRRDSNSSASNYKTTGSESSVGGNSPPFFDVDVDASSAAVKEAMEKAQAKLKSAKELLERKRDGARTSIKPGSATDRIIWEGKLSHNEVKLHVLSPEVEKNTDVARKSSADEHGKKSLPSHGSAKFDENDEWKEATQFFELVRTEKSGNNGENIGSKNISLPQNSEFREQEQKEKRAAEVDLDKQQERKAKGDGRDPEVEKLPKDLGSTKVAYRHKRHEKESLAKNVLQEGMEEKSRNHFLHCQVETKIPDHGLTSEQERYWPFVDKSAKQKKELRCKENNKGIENQERVKKTRPLKAIQKKQDGLFDWEENAKKLKEALGVDDNDSTLEVSLEPKEDGKAMKMAGGIDENEKKLKEALERIENENRMKENHEKEESDRGLREALEKAENERRWTAALEQEEKERRLKEACEKEGNERRTREALEKAENGKRMKEQEDMERRIKEACEKEEKKQRMKEAHEKAEHERKLKIALEQEEERRIKEACEKEENEQRIKQAREKVEVERRLKEAVEQEEEERKLKEAHEALERAENQRRLKEALEHEERDRQVKGAQEKEENERKLKEAVGREERERRLTEALEKAERERKLKVALEQEGMMRIQGEGQEREGSENRDYQVNEEKQVERMRQGNEERLEEALEREEIHEKRGEAGEREKTDKISDLSELLEECLKEAQEEDEYDWEDNRETLDNVWKEEDEPEQAETRDMSDCTSPWKDFEKKLKAVCIEEGVEGLDGGCGLFERNGEVKGLGTDGEDYELNGASDEVSKLGTKNIQENVLAGFAGKLKKKGERFEISQETSALEENVERATNVKDDKKRWEGAVADEKVQKTAEDGVSRVHRNPGESKCTSKKSSDLGNHENKFSHHQEDTGTQASLNQDAKLGKLSPPRFVKDSVDNARKMVAPNNTSQTAGNKNRNLDEISKQREKEAERIKRERELEMERLRKIEEEREREREREKDRMAFDQRALADARERLEKACAEAREKSLADKLSADARLRAERAAVERATAEARERAAEKAALEARERVERSVPSKQFQSSASFGASRYQNSSASTGADGESPQRYISKLERHRRTAERVAKALAEKNMRDLVVQREQAERNRLAEALDAEVKRWSGGKEGNIRALLSTLQYILGPESGWQPIPLTEVITSAAVKKAYRKATLCVHPDKLQQRGASVQQKYICEKVFDLLKEAWNRFNSEER